MMNQRQFFLDKGIFSGKFFLSCRTAGLAVFPGIFALIFLLGACGSGDSPHDRKVQSSSWQPEATVLALAGERQEWHEAVGTVRPRTESSIEARIAGQVKEIRVRSGSRVEKGELLILLDDRQVRARMEQAREGLGAARSARNEVLQAIEGAEASLEAARLDYERIQGFFSEGAATRRQVEQATSVFHQARAAASRAREGLAGADASIRQAEEVLKEAEIAHDYTRIRAPESGEVLKRLVEPGDMAVPGRSLLLLQTSGFLRLEAYVPEGLFTRVRPGESLSVRIRSLNTLLPAEVEELVPYADPETRTFLVKASLPEKEGLYPGMFGTLRIPLGSRPAVWLPSSAIRRVGQLDQVKVAVEDRWEKRYVTTGERMDDGMVEILSGLDGGERVALQRLAKEAS
ncbi:efflux RND transporter periplasmic adaptor subunit [Desulfobotulus mexicanus]|uniref:Efflux RND transporter periplasmic adaptor subunit n=1 Tax=Desulfobotulus mexicanus TaxID=2586642 RepID=A0A5S5MFP9_9BACT|nr:efflux RND transporter periplasmic adaptor subunit [Desulfobotulus mexicanus]TYT74518.1 efflux RND transporter periplasmic adaptor subunit [Desulfobotulus mexicanus]